MSSPTAHRLPSGSAGQVEVIDLRELVTHTDARSVAGGNLQATLDEARRLGREEGRAEAVAHVARLGQAIQTALASADLLSEAQRTAATTALVDLALEIATAVLGRTPHDGGAALLERLRDELDRHTDTPSRLELHPADAAAIGPTLPPELASRIVADASLDLGEARITGAWGSCDLTHEAALTAIRHMLSSDGD